MAPEIVGAPKRRPKRGAPTHAHQVFSSQNRELVDNRVSHCRSGFFVDFFSNMLSFETLTHPENYPVRTRREIKKSKARRFW